MLGKNIKRDGPLVVSFCFGSKYVWNHDGGDVLHGVRVKIFPDPGKFREIGSFTMDLYGKCSASRTSPDTVELMPIRKFFKKYVDMYGLSESGDNYNHRLKWPYVRPAGCRRKPFDYYPRGRVEYTNKGKPKIYLNHHVDERFKKRVHESF